METDPILQSSCKESIKIIENSKADFNSSKSFLVPKISCLVCSQPIIGNSSNKGKSTLKFPLYNNILEFGFVKNYIPMNTDVTIKINDECSYKLVVTRDANPNTIQTIVFECVNKICSKQMYVKLPENRKCLQIGLMFNEEIWIHLSITRGCKYVPTIYFRQSLFLKFNSKKCKLHTKIDKLNVLFEFSAKNSFPMDAIPLALPCSPGGYVVNPASGKFYSGSECVMNFIDPLYPLYNSGILFVVKFLYGGNRSLVFPNKSSRKYASKTYPIYLFENGSAASREEMAPKVEKGEMSNNKSKIMCSIGNETKPPKCSEENLALDHEKIWESDVNYKMYVPRYSCLLCAKPECDYRNRKCEKWASTGHLPVYFNLIEFGLYGLNFPKKTEIKIFLNVKCFLKIQITPIFNPDQVNVSISECPLKDSNCRVFFATKEYFSFHRNCFFLALGFDENKKIYFGISITCASLPTSMFSYHDYLNHTQESCHVNTTNLTVQYRFLQDDRRLSDGVALILPCSPGGYAVDPYTGKFLINENCETLYWQTKNLMDKGISVIIDKFYQNDENLNFPITKNETEGNKDSSFLPTYISEEFERKFSEEMKPTNVKRKNQTRRIRVGCYYNTSIFEKFIQKLFLHGAIQNRSEKPQQNQEKLKNKSSELVQKSAGFSVRLTFDVTGNHFLILIIFTLKYFFFEDRI
ncbi:UNVERIFIED_CONTAM: hypothetical protein RMT77_014695 [Armadillidium vulgare]